MPGKRIVKTSQKSGGVISDNLKVQRDKLNSFVGHLHKVHKNGLSAYSAIGLRAFNPSLFFPSLSWPDIHTHTKKDYEAFIELCEEMTVALQSAGGTDNTVLHFIHAEEWAPSWQSSLIESANKLAKAAHRLKELVDQLGSQLNASLNISTSSAFDRGLMPLINALVEVPGTHLVHLLAEELIALRSHAEEAQVLQAIRKKLISRLSSHYQDDVESKIDVQHLVTLYAESKKSWWPKKIFRHYQALKTIKPFVSSKPDLDTDVSLIHKLLENRSTFGQHKVLERHFKLEWNEFDTDFEVILHCIAHAHSKTIELMQEGKEENSVIAYKEKLNQFLENHSKLLSAEAIAAINLQLALTQRITESTYQLGLSTPITHQLLDYFQTVLTDTQRLASHTVTGAKVIELGHALQKFQEEREVLESLVVGKLTETKEGGAPWLSTIANTLHSLVHTSPLLKNWCDWQKYRKIANARGLESLVEAAESGLIRPDKIKDAFKLGYANWWLKKLMDEDEVLRCFSPAQHERIIDKFRELDADYQALTCKCIRALLAANNKPGKEDKEQVAEFGILQREITKKSKHIPLRTLISKMPTGLTRLTPCLLMSPLSVAQYLPAD